jgi:hypothetical protein
MDWKGRINAYIGNIDQVINTCPTQYDRGKLISSIKGLVLIKYFIV